jgi:sodium transport system permease protein
MSPTWLIFTKELREMMRDKRVRSSALFGPIFLIIIILFLFGFIMEQVTKPQNQKIHVVNAQNTFVESLRKDKVQIISVSDESEARRLVAQGQARAVLRFEPDFDNKLKQDQATAVKVFFDPDQANAQISLGFLAERIAKLNQAAAVRVLAANSIDPNALVPVQLVREEVRVGKRSSGEMLIGMLPYLIVIWAFYGGMSIVGDLVAGEKEKSTLETLLISPAERKDIALGKLLALSVVCLLSSLSSVLGVVLVAALNLPITREIFKDGMGLTPLALGVIILVLIPTVALFASAMLAVSAYSRNVRESQTYLTMISFVVLMPAIFSQVIGFTDLASNRLTNLVPVLNTANSIRQALLGKVDWVGIGLTVGVSAILALIALIITVRMFEREEVLVRV